MLTATTTLGRTSWSLPVGSPTTERDMDISDFLRQLKLAVALSTLVFGLGWTLAGARSTILLIWG